VPIHVAASWRSFVLQAFAQGHQFSQPPRVELSLFFVGEGAIGEGFEPVGGEVGGDALEQGFGAFEGLGEDAVEAVVVGFVFYQAGSGEVVEVFC
jgi:hypothetical protein